MENIEKFISANRKDFDDAFPPDGIWENVKNSLNDELAITRKKKILFIRTIASVAAMLVLVFAAGILLYKARASRLDYSTIDPLLAKQQIEYDSLVQEKRETLFTMASDKPKLYQEFSTVIDNMQRNYKQLKTELRQSPNKELTLEAMINNLKIQIEVLNQQLEILNAIHQREKKTPYEQL